MTRLLFLLAFLSGLSGLIFSLATPRASRHETLPPSLGYADTISEGVASN